MKNLKLYAVFGCGLIVGAAALGFYARYVESQMVDAQANQLASQSAQMAEWLAEVRLGETNSVIAGMETAMDANVGALAKWATQNPPSEKMRKARDYYLRDVKIYHQSYPVTGDDAESVTALLATVPGRQAKSTGRSGIDRLDDLRQARTGATTNSP